MPSGFSTSNSMENTYLPEDYTMGDLFKNSAIRDKRKAEEAQLLEDQRLEFQKKEMEDKINNWVEGNKQDLSWMYLFGTDFHEDSYEKTGLIYEHSQTQLESMALRDYLKGYLSEEDIAGIKTNYNKIMNEDPKKNWRAGALQNQLKNNGAGLNEFGKENKLQIQAKEAEIAEAERKEREKCDDWYEKPGCFVKDVAGKVIGFVGDVFGEVGSVLLDVPILGDALELASDGYNSMKEFWDGVGQDIKNSGAFGEWVYNVGDTIHEEVLRQAIGKFAPDFIWDADDTTQLLVGKDIEDMTLYDTGELIGAELNPVADALLTTHDVIQAGKAKQEEDRQTALEKELEAQYGDKPQQTPQEPMRLIQPQQQASKPKGQARERPKVERDTVIKQTIPEPQLKPREPPRQTQTTTGPNRARMVCRSPRKPMKCNS